MSSVQARWIAPDDAEFPTSLRDLAVKGLWALGCDLRDLGPMLAIIGARAPTHYGADVAHSLAADAATSGMCVVSGMARGIDGAAHEGALSAGGPTLAVLGSGVDVPYPQQNLRLYRRILDNGAVISEVPLGSPPYPSNFPARNRIIAALSVATVLVQAAKQTSGGMVTARRAFDLGREVLAVPGDVRAAVSWGPHELIKSGVAGICRSFGDVQDALGFKTASAQARAWIDPAGLDEAETLVLSVVTSGPARAEHVSPRAGVDPVVCARALTKLELLGVLKRSPVGEYHRVR